jgi:CRP/FNR family cyclic AMP-dependent transcriptional regulator
MSSAYIYSLLKGLGLDESSVRQMMPHVRMTAFDADDVIWSKGEQVTAWTYIVSGLVGASIPLQEGGCIHVNVYGHRTWFGEEALLNRYPSCLEYVCLGPVRAVSIPAIDTLAAFQNEPEFSRYIALLMAWRSRQHSEMIVLMKQGSWYLRVVMGLALFAEALNYNSSRPPTHGLEGPSLKIPVKQSVIASVCGVSRGMFNDAAQQLSAAGWLYMNYATLELRSPETWLRFSRQQRQARINITKPSMEELLQMMAQASRI